MYIIVNIVDDVFIMSGEHLDYMDNGYPRLVDENVAFPTDTVSVFENITIPEGVIPAKYCYTSEKGFHLNPNYVEPNKYGIPDGTLKVIQADYTEQLIREGVIA